MKKVIFIFTLMFMVISLTACSNSSKTELEAFSQQVQDKNTEINNLKLEIEALKSKVTEMEKLTEKYQLLSDSEILAQTEANKLKAEQDRITSEKLIAEEKAKSEKEQAEKLAAQEAEAKKGYETGITYNQLARTPDDYKGKKVKFFGTVIQVVEGADEINLRIAINDDYNKVVLVYYPPKLLSSRVLEDDKITFYGVSAGRHTYESTNGGYITVPLIEIEKIDQ